MIISWRWTANDRYLRIGRLCISWVRVLVIAALVLPLEVAAQSPALPDPQLTPGDIATSDPDVICRPGYSASQRVWNTQSPWAYRELRHLAFARYGISWERRNDFELDDLVPLCLGGRQTIKNVWPEPWLEAHQKDGLEAMMCRAACQVHTVEAITAAQRYFIRRAWVKDLK